MGSSGEYFLFVLAWTNPRQFRPPNLLRSLTVNPASCSAAVNNQTSEGVAIKKITNVFSKKILAKRALRELKLLQHFRGHRNVRATPPHPPAMSRLSHCHRFAPAVAGQDPSSVNAQSLLTTSQ